MDILPPSLHLTNCILFLSRALSCDLILKLAKDRLREVWDGDSPPSASSPISNLDSQHFIVAIHANQFARARTVPRVLKRALYEVLSSRAFWRARDGARTAGKAPVHRELLGALSVAGKDQYRLASAREKLDARWRDLGMSGAGGGGGGLLSAERARERDAEGAVAELRLLRVSLGVLRGMYPSARR
ncbi:hypothetical protein V8D89_007114 [Ganoderma adspersum]